MAKCVSADLLLDTGGPNSIGNGLVNGTWIQMVAADDACARVN
jgi:hypothetical protein